MSNKTKHTSAEWENHGCNIYTSPNWKDGNDHGSKFVATTFEDREDKMPTDEEIQRAKLIAACPDLLEALQNIILSANANDGDSLANAINDARSAITKSTGQ